MNKEVKHIPMSKWGADHWATLLYAESRWVDHGGNLDLKHMRCNKDVHPTLSHLAQKSNLPTRLKGGEPLNNHDDWSCVDDLEREDLLSRTYLRVKLTDKGAHIAGLARKWIAQGNLTQDFTFSYIDWSKIPEGYNYAAISYSGKIMYSVSEMEYTNGYWDSTDTEEFLYIVPWEKGEENIVMLPLGVDWRLTQEKRPE